VFGETPYAEFQGDVKTLQLRPELRGPLATMRRLKQQGVPVVAVMLTGRPLFTGAELNTADAFVVAWLPGSEGAGVADRLFAGASNPGFTGRLAMPWPATARGMGPVLYPLGYGLSGREKTAWAPVSEDPGVSDADAGGVYFADGVPASAWSLRVSDGVADSLRVTTVPAQALGGRVRVTAVDARVQEGARAFEFRGGGMQQVSLDASAPLDLTREANGDVLVVATIRFDTPPAADATVFARCAAGCDKGVPIRGVPTGRFTTVGVPLKCLGSGLSAVETPFAIRSSGAMRFALARTALGTEADTILGCK
jgi:beta-glucosidase